MRRLPLALVAASIAVVVGCASDAEPRPSDPGRGASAGDGSATVPPPDPQAPLPREAGTLAARLEATQLALEASIDRWRSEGDLEAWPPPRDVTLWALHQQRIHLRLADRAGAAGPVLERLPVRVARHLRATIRARRGLRRITPPTPGRYRTGPPEPPARLLAYYRTAQRRFSVPWPVLAAINFVESAFGRMRNSSAAGAQGPMQFIPSTWAAYGLGGDVNDPHDAILGAAHYLRANGAPGALRTALYRYNPSDLYVNAVLAYGDRIRRDRRAFLSYYAWQVFVRRPGGGTRRITGPARVEEAGAGADTDG